MGGPAERDSTRLQRRQPAEFQRSAVARDQAADKKISERVHLFTLTPVTPARAKTP